MPAPIGNTYSQVWTKEKALNLFKSAIELLKADQEEYDNFKPKYEGEKAKYKINCLETLAVKLDTYTDIFRHLIARFGGEDDNLTIIEGDLENLSEDELFAKEFVSLKNKIGAILASRLTEAGLHNKVNTIMSIFLLKANHNKVENTKIDISNSDGTLKAPQLTPLEVKSLTKQALEDI